MTLTEQFLTLPCADGSEREVAALIVDSILGTGFSFEQVRKPYATWIDLANASCAQAGTTIISADCPSGLSSQTGKAAAQCKKADITLTMLALKCGLLNVQATPFVGKLILAPLV